MDKRLLLYLALKSLTKAQRDSADAYLGPGKSFPVWADGRQLREAWDMAGQADDPDAIRQAAINFAKKHGLMDKLPQSAQEWAAVHARKSEGYDPSDDPDQEPDNDADDSILSQIGGSVVQKTDGAIEVAKSMPIMKAWSSDGVTYIEGWLSTPAMDIEKDSVQPEAFAKSMDPYFQLGAPLTSEHQMKPDPARGVFVRYPVGHIQKAALVRDGQPFQTASHPTDSADFAHFPGMGTGVYVRAALTDALASDQVAKGNVRGFSWVGRVLTKPLPGGRYNFTEVTAWRESTIAAFPINQEASITARM